MTTAGKIMRGVVLVGVFALTLLPFVIANSLFFPFITGKAFFFRIIVEIIFAAWLALALFEPRYRPRLTAVGWSVVAFLGVVTLADVFGESFFRSFWSNFERMEGLITLLHLGAYFFVAGAVLDTEKLWKRFWQTSVAVSALVGFYGLLQLAGVFAIHQGGVRLDATFGNATYLAVYMLFHVFLTAWLLYRHEGGRGMRWVYAGLIVLQLFILIQTATRGAVLGVVSGIVLTTLLVALFGRAHQVARKWSVVTLLAVIVLGGVFFSVRHTSLVQESPVLKRFANISLEDKTVRSRFILWGMTLDGIKEKPILGWGQENYMALFSTHYDPQMIDQEPWFDRAHNVLLDWLVNAGVLGLLAYLSLFASVLWLLWRRTSPFDSVEASLFTGLLAGYFVHNVFVFDNITSYLVFFGVLAFVHRRSLKTTDTSVDTRTHTFTPSAAHALTVVIVLATLFGIYALNGTGFLTNRSLLQAIRPQQEGPLENLRLFKQAVAYGGLGRQESSEQFSAAAVQFAQLAIPDEAKQDAIVSARDALLARIEEEPQNARLPFFLGGMFLRLGALNEAEHFLTEARTLSPNKQQILFDLGILHLIREEFGKALVVLEEAHALEPSSSQARIAYARAAVLTQMDSLAQELLEPVFGDATPQAIADLRAGRIVQ